MEKEKIVVLDFGGQYTQLIARCIREAGVYSEIYPAHTPAEKFADGSLKGIVLSGGPDSVYAPGAKRLRPDVLALGLPVLGICYGMQELCCQLGGQVAAPESREYGPTPITFDAHPLFRGIDAQTVWMNHNDQVMALPDGFVSIARTANCPTAAFADNGRKIYGVQFHPEVTHGQMGAKLFYNFCRELCGCEGSWRVEDLAGQLVAEIKEKAGGKKIICGLSGGVDSSVAAVLAHRAVGDNLTCIFVDHGLLRKNEAEEVMGFYGGSLGMKIVKVDAAALFLGRLQGVTDPEQKRKIIGEEFIRVFEQKAAELGGADYLVQGTIYPDVVESGAGESAVIKSHHNVGGLPEDISFRGLIEPLRLFFKDEVRRLGESLGIPHQLVWRQPFPGPGLAIRVIGEITEEKLRIVRETDQILRDEIAAAHLDEKIWQYFTVMTGVQTVGVMGDGRTYEYVVAVRAVTSDDAMTSSFAEIPYPILAKISSRMVNEVQGCSRVVYDITSKPPATIEWE